MSETSQGQKRPAAKKVVQGEKLRGAEKVARIPVKVIPSVELPVKPSWIRAKLPASPEISRIKQILRKHKLASVCEEAACPNLGECFSGGTATFMIMGDICTRRCPFCDVAHGKPQALDLDEPKNLAHAIELMQLSYVVITSVARDDLADGGAEHFVNGINEIRKLTPNTKVEILVPDFRHKIDKALAILKDSPPDVFNHNLESIPRLYKKIRPVADYPASLELIKKFKQQNPDVSTKSGLMLGLGETLDEVKQVLHDLKEHGCDMITIGQYLQPSRYHLAVERFVHPEEFDELGRYAENLGFMNVASAPMVRSSYHADLQAMGETLSS